MLCTGGLLSDVLLYEEYPSSYSADVSRRHRWIRGDWQIAQWLLPGVPGLVLMPVFRRTLSGLSKWKIFGQSSTQSCSFGIDAPLAAGLDSLVTGLVLDLVGNRIFLIPPLMPLFWKCFRSRTMRVWISTSPSQCTLRAHACPGPIYARVSALRGFFQPGCYCAHRVANADAHTTSGWSPSGDADRGSRNIGRPRSRLPDDVDRPHDCHRCIDLSVAFEAGSVSSPVLCWDYGLPPCYRRGGSAGRSPAAEQG